MASAILNEGDHGILIMISKDIYETLHWENCRQPFPFWNSPVLTSRGRGLPPFALPSNGAKLPDEHL
jgi:hypothetical protein